MKNLLKRNIKLLYVIRAVRTFLIVMPIIVPFFQANGLGQTQVFLLQSLFAITIVLFEVPSGYFADRFGRKRSIVMGTVFSALGFGVYSVAQGFSTFILGEFLMGIGYVFISGADSALAYDSLLELGDQKDYRRFEGRSNALWGMSEATASLIGGALVVFSLRAPFIAQTIIYSALVPVALMLYEPKRVKTAVLNPFKDLLRITAYSLHGHQEIKWFILYAAVARTLTHTMAWLTQPYYQLVGIPLRWFGILWAIQLLAMGFFSLGADRYERWLGKRRALISFIVIGVLSYTILGLAPSLVILPAILGIYFVLGIQTPILQDYVNGLVDSDIRATVLSVKNLVQKLLYAGLGPLIGVIVDAYSLQTGLLFSAVLYGILGTIALFNMKRLKIV